MTVKELMEELGACDPEQEVEIFDAVLTKTFELTKVYIDMDPDAALLTFYNFKRS